jgi:outer membrane protein assembly factor BamB
VLWSHTIAGESLLSAATATDEGLYVSGTTGLYYLDIASGQQLWQSEYDFAVSRWVRPLLGVAEGQICVGLRLPGGQSMLICMKLADRKTIWSKTVQPVSSLRIAGDRLYLRSQDVLALDMDDGSLLWGFGSTGCSPVTHANGRVWFIDSRDQGRLVALDERTGRKVLDLAGIRSCDAFLELDDRGYIKTHDGLVHVILFKG